MFCSDLRCLYDYAVAKEDDINRDYKSLLEKVNFEKQGSLENLLAKRDELKEARIVYNKFSELIGYGSMDLEDEKMELRFVDKLQHEILTEKNIENYGEGIGFVKKLLTNSKNSLKQSRRSIIKNYIDETDEFSSTGESISEKKLMREATEDLYAARQACKNLCALRGEDYESSGDEDSILSSVERKASKLRLEKIKSLNIEGWLVGAVQVGSMLPVPAVQVPSRVILSAYGAGKAVDFIVNGIPYSCQRSNRFLYHRRWNRSRKSCRLYI